MPSSTQKKPQDHKSKAKKTTRRREEQGEQNPFVQPIPTPVEDPNSKYAPDAWLSGGFGGMEDLRTPSGQLCLVRRPGMEGLMKAGVLHNIDSLSQVVNSKHLKTDKDGDPEVDVKSLMNDPSALAEVTHVVDRVVTHCVVKPEVFMTPNDVTRRKDGVVYADMIDLVDKMHIFNFVVGGTRDLESFRKRLSESVGSLDAGEDVQVQAE